MTAQTLPTSPSARRIETAIRAVLPGLRQLRLMPSLLTINSHTKVQELQTLSVTYCNSHPAGLCQCFITFCYEWC